MKFLQNPDFFQDRGKIQTQHCECSHSAVEKNAANTQSYSGIGTKLNLEVAPSPGQFDIYLIRREASCGIGSFITNRESIGFSAFAETHGGAVPTGQEEMQNYLAICHAVRFGQDPFPYGRIIYFPRLGIDLERRLQVMPIANAEQDTYLDNDVGTAIRSVKAKFGKTPFIETYKRVLNTSKKLDDRRKESLEEEVRLRSVLRAGED